MSCLCPISIPDKVLARLGYNGRSIVVPCGHCVGCAKDHVNDWFVRLYTVYKDFESRGLPVWFVTVTVDPKLWPGMTKDTPGVRDCITPWIRSWNERLRYLNGGVMPLRFLCSEFGSSGEQYFDHNGVLRVTTGALHFHGFLFGKLPLRRIIYGLAQTHGHVDFDRVRSASCIRYAVKYATKDYSVSDPLLRSRVFCSPGIGDPSFYFGNSEPTSHVLINGFHYRCPRYLVDKQWYAVFGRSNCFDSEGRSIFCYSRAIDRLESEFELYNSYRSACALGPVVRDRFIRLSGLDKSKTPDYKTVRLMLESNLVGPGHPVLRYHDKCVSDCKLASLLWCDDSFSHPLHFQSFIDQFNIFNYEGYQTFLSFPQDFET